MAVTNTKLLAQPDVCFKRRWVWVLFGLFAVAAMWGGQHIFKKEKITPPPLVFLIPADFWASVFFSGSLTGLMFNLIRMVRH